MNAVPWRSLSSRCSWISRLCASSTCFLDTWRCRPRKTRLSVGVREHTSLIYVMQSCYGGANRPLMRIMQKDIRFRNLWRISISLIYTSPKTDLCVIIRNHHSHHRFANRVVFNRFLIYAGNCFRFRFFHFIYFFGHIYIFYVSLKKKFGEHFLEAPGSRQPSAHGSGLPITGYNSVRDHEPITGIFNDRSDDDGEVCI